MIQQPAAPSNSCEVENIIDGQNQTESTSTAAPTNTCPTIELILSTNSITPEIGEVRFGSIIAVPGAPQAHTQPHIDGGTVDITVRVTGLPDNSNIPVTLDFKTQQGTGGHTHISGRADDTTKRAFGRFIGPGVDNNNPLKMTGKTDASGELKVTFRAENLISDYSSASGILEFTATANLQGQPAQSSTKPLAIEIPGLKPLPRESSYTMHGDNRGHHGGNNHWATPAVILAIQNIAKEYATSHNGDLLNIGEISLQLGGVFDFWGDWNPAESNDRHKAHACGTDVDVHALASNGKSINSTDLAMITIQQFPGAFVTTESDYYHIHFGDCTVADANPDFSIACPSGVTRVVRGSSTDFDCTITSQQGFNRPVNLACQPSNNQPTITCKISPTSVAPPADGSASFTLTIITTKDTPLGKHDIKVQGTSSGIQHDTTVTIALPLIEIKAVKAGGSLFWHLYIVYTDDNGNQYITRAGPSERNGPPYGYIQPCNDNYGQGNECGDWHPNPPSITVLEGEKVNPSVIKCLDLQTHRIDSKKVPYELTGPNSNSYVYTLLYNCGIPAKTPVFAVGWGKLI